MSVSIAVPALHAFFCYLLSSPLNKQKYPNILVLKLQNHFLFLATDLHDKFESKLVLRI